jgi:hypothetical protein
MDETTSNQHEIRSVRRGRPPKAKEVDSHAQELASRIWSGQSPDLPRVERLARVERGLAAQGLSMDGVEL